MERIPYFDAHCDTIYRACGPERSCGKTMLIWICTGRRASGGSPRCSPCIRTRRSFPGAAPWSGRDNSCIRSSCGRWSEPGRHCPLPHRRRGGPGRGRRENGGDSLHRGGRAHRLRPGTGGDGGGMGRAVSQPRVELAQCSVRHQLPGHGSGPLPSWCRLPAAAGGVPYLPRRVPHQRPGVLGCGAPGPGAGGGHPLQQPGPVPPPAQPYR